MVPILTSSQGNVLPPAQFSCVTQVVFQEDCFEYLGALLKGSSTLLVTSRGWITRGLLDRLDGVNLTPVKTVIGEGIPTLSWILAQAPNIPKVDYILAIGGGSVIDSAKAFSFWRNFDSEQTFCDYIKNGRSDCPLKQSIPPIIAVPTTTGSGAEVTRWATIWGEKQKYSLEHPALYPQTAILDTGLISSLSATEILLGALDTMSHAMEAVWNRSHSPLSDLLASNVIATVRTVLPSILGGADALELRAKLQTASLIGGLLINSTRTALAHALSYSLTIYFGVPHGLATGFLLPSVFEHNGRSAMQRLLPISEAFQCSQDTTAVEIDRFVQQFGLNEKILQYVGKDIERLLFFLEADSSRAKNNIAPVNIAHIKASIRDRLSR